MTDNQQSTSAPFRFAISSTFTADPIRSTLAFWSRFLGMDAEVRIGPYNQLLQSILDPQSALAGNQNGVNILLARLEDFSQSSREGSAQRIEQNVQDFIQDLLPASSRFAVPTVFCLCPSTPGLVPYELEQRLRGLLSAAGQSSPNLHCLDHCDVERLYPVAEPHSSQGERLGNIPYSDLYFCALGTMLVRYTHSLVRPPFKVVALDCDNTLWEGICGEDGPHGVRIDQPRRALQEFVLEQRENGMLLTLASKNNEQDVWDTFAAHADMPLQPRHLVAWRLNWEPKAGNITELAEQLGLGLDSFIFIDDNPKECAELEGALPEVLTLALPEPATALPHFISHIWAFDRPVVTEEDRKRSTYYEQQQRFGAESRRAGSLQEFMASLQLRVSILPLSPDRLARVAQLTQRTNQFNFTTVRRSAAEIDKLCSETHGCFTVDVSDRFGDYGLVGVLIVSFQNDEISVDTFLLSCRALGRGVEHQMLSFLGKLALDRGLHSVVLQYTPTAKNQPARQFLDTLPAGDEVTGVSKSLIRLPASKAAQFTWTAPAESGGTTAEEKRAVTPNTALLKKVDYARIANQLSTPEQILAAARNAFTAEVPSEPLSDLEAQLAQIWAELLERGDITREANFFDLGGHSLIAVLLLMRIRETFGVELAIDDVYSGTLTLGELATRIETAQIGDVNPDEYAALLAEIEGLTDEEARELLEREQAGQR